MKSQTRIGSPYLYYALLFALWVFHSLNNVYYLLTTDPPPNYDCGYHLQLSIHVYDALFDFDSNEYWFGLLTSSGFYPFFAYIATIPFYLVFGLNQDAAIAGNLIWLAILLWATFEIGRSLKSPMAGFFSAALLSFFPFVFGISRNYYIETALMAATALSALSLCKTEGFSQRKKSLLFGVTVGIGMMIKWTFAIHLLFPVLWVFVSTFLQVLSREPSEKIRLHPYGAIFVAVGFGLVATALTTERILLWGFAACLPVLLGLALLSTSADWRRRLLNISLAGTVATVLCYPWYIRYWDHISGIANNFFDSEFTEQAGSWTFAAFLYYPFTLESNLMGPALFVGFLVSIFLFPWKEIRRFGIVISWVLGSYILTSNIPFKDPRFVSPFLPGVALFMGIALANLSTGRLRWGMIGLVSIGAVWQFGMITFGWPLPSSNHWRLGPYGYTYSLWNHGVYGTARDREDKWPHREIVRDFKEEVLKKTEPETKPVLRCLIDDPGIHQGVFEFIAEAERGGWESVFDRVTYRLDLELDRWADSEAILYPEAPLEGDLYRMRDSRHPSEFAQSPTSFLRIRFPNTTDYQVPSGATVVMAFQDEGRTLVRDQEHSFRLGVRLEILSGEFQKFRIGEDWLLRTNIDWRYLHNDNWPISELNRVWIDLYTPEGEWVASKDFPLEPGFETDQEVSMTYDWVLPPSYNEGIFQVGLGVGSEDRQSRIETLANDRGDPLPILFLNKLLYLGE